MPFTFGKFRVDRQVFYATEHSFALVNLRPLLPFHVLVCPRRNVDRLKHLTPIEVSDFFLTVQKVSDVVEELANGDSLNIAIQDGALAGQSVPHLHCHIIPRRLHDLKQDEIYKLLESDEADLEKAFSIRKAAYSKFSAPHDAERIARTDDIMEEEAKELAKHFSDSFSLD